MPYWMRDTRYVANPPPNLEAEIFRQILLPSGYQEARRTVIYPMWSAGGVSVRAGLPGGGALQRTVPRLSGVYSAGEWHTSAQICRLMCSDQCADVSPRDTRIRPVQRTAALISHNILLTINSGIGTKPPEYFTYDTSINIFEIFLSIVSYVADYMRCSLCNF